MELQNFLQRGLVTAQCECPRWFSHTSRLCAFLGRTKTLYFFGPITCCLTPGFLNGATFPPTKQWGRDIGHLDSPFLHRRQGQGQQWVYNTVSHTMLDQTLASWLEHDSEFPELLVLESKLEWIFKDALDSVSDSESHSRYVHCQQSPQMTKEYSRMDIYSSVSTVFVPSSLWEGPEVQLVGPPVGISGFPRRFRATGLRK